MNIAVSMTAWRRPEYFEKVLESVIGADGTQYPIHISIDGGYAESQKVMRNCVKHKIPNASVYAHQENLGCASNTNYALARGFQDPSIEAVIHLEDDTLVHPQFFEFMRQALEHYKEVPQIFSISGYANGNLQTLTEVWGGNNIGIRQRFTCWGWAITREVWNEMKTDWFGGTFTNYEKFEQDAANGINSYLECIEQDPKGSWAFPMNFHWRKDRLEIAPDESLVQNIGVADSTFATGLTSVLQHTDSFDTTTIYESWDFEMADMELEEMG